MITEKVSYRAIGGLKAPIVEASPTVQGLANQLEFILD